MQKIRGNRYSISVSRQTYDRLRAAVPPGGIAGFVDKIMKSALDDPAILTRMLDKCGYDEEVLS